jgi:hypothetical protein
MKTSDNFNERVARIIGYDGPLIADIGYPEYSTTIDLAMRDCVPWIKARGYGVVIDLDHGDDAQLYKPDSEHPIRTWPITDPPSIARAIGEAVVWVAEGGEDGAEA